MGTVMLAAQHAAEADGRGLQPIRAAVLDTNRGSLTRGRSLAAIRWAAGILNFDAFYFMPPLSPAI
jgi:hypothetical protein